MQNASCPPNPGLNQYDYFIDFTNPPPDLAEDWSTSNYATITYNTRAKNGAEFTFAKRMDAPQLFTNFYIFFGRVDVVMQVAPGTAMISSAVLMSDDFDEIDWEMSGNDFNLARQYPNGVVQNNYFSKGITGWYDRGQWQVCTRPQTQFHTYSFDWTPTKLDWLIDGQVVRTFLASQADNNDHQYPQTPSKFQLGIWSGGDPDQNSGTRDWAGGITNITAGPYTMFVKSVKIQNYNPAQHYKWTDQSGSWKSIKLINDTAIRSSSTSSSQKSTSSSNLSSRPASSLPITSSSLSSTISSITFASPTVAKTTSTPAISKTSGGTRSNSVASVPTTSSTSASSSDKGASPVVLNPAVPAARTSTSLGSASNPNPIQLTPGPSSGTGPPSSSSSSSDLGGTSSGSTSVTTRSDPAAGGPHTRSSVCQGQVCVTLSPSTAAKPTMPPPASETNRSPSAATATTPGVTGHYCIVGVDDVATCSILRLASPTTKPAGPSTSTSVTPKATGPDMAPSAGTSNLQTSWLWPFSKSQNGLCAYRGFAVCAGSGFGDCCSRWGYCGKTEAYCGANCLGHWGSCLAGGDGEEENRGGRRQEQGEQHQWERRARAYPPGRRPQATEIV
ncbi:hypothetical protein TruAng_005236 [Truncatella angustata]|nr:hypothetical protein TruAng_005236 [Truncatella angustata]